MEKLNIIIYMHISPLIIRAKQSKVIKKSNLFKPYDFAISYKLLQVVTRVLDYIL